MTGERTPPFTLTLLDEAVGDLRALDPEAKRRVRQKLQWLAENAEMIQHYPLSGDLAGLYKRRVGSYRILYQLVIEKRRLVVHRIGHRSEVYGG